MNKKAFTLIELLAVIVILAIIALIAVPIVVNIINDSKKESLKRSMDIYIETVEKKVTQENMKKRFNPYYCEGESGKELTCYDSKNNSLGEINIEIKNKVPNNVKLYFNNGKVLKDETLELEIEGYYVSSDEDGNLLLKSSDDTGKHCVLYEDVLDGEKLEQSEYVDYMGYIEYTGGMTIEQAYSAQNMAFTSATFDTTEKKWIVENIGHGYGAYYIVQESGYYQLTVEKGNITYVMDAKDEDITTKYMNFEDTNYIENTSSEITYLEAGEKILILNSTYGSSFYITKSNENKIKKSCKKYKYDKGTSIISKTKSYIGYYADVDGDGTVDGVIYADLAQSSPSGSQWINSNGTYSYTAKTNLKEYVVNKEKYYDYFGKKEIITLKSGTTGNNRFYVMALEDFRTEYSPTDSYCWYDHASEGLMSTWETDTSTSFGTGYTNTGKIIEIWNKNGEGEGSYSGASQSNLDIWKYIQENYEEGWYIPSRGEWAAFANYLVTKTNNSSTDINYHSYHLMTGYWTSSQSNVDDAWAIAFYRYAIEEYNVFGDWFIRLGITF